MTISLGELSEKVRGRSVVAVELRAGRSSYDKIAGQWQVFLNINAVLAEPGWEHSSYREWLLAELPEQAWNDVEALAVGLSEALAVPLSKVSRTERLSRSASWIAAQPQPEPIDWQLDYRGIWWRPDGRRVDVEGRTPARGVSGEDACAQCGPELAQRLSSDGHGFARVRVGLAQLGQWRLNEDTAGIAWPDEVPEPEYFRGRARGGERPSVMLRVLPPGRPLAAMIVVARSFALPLEELDIVGATGRGEADEAALDAQLSPLIYGREVKWNLPWLLAGARRRKEPMRPFMLGLNTGGVGTIQMAKGLMVAFGIPLSGAKVLIDRCCSPDCTDEAFQERFDALVGER